LRPARPETQNDLLNAACDVHEGFISVGPGSKRRGIARKRLQMRERRAGPLDWTQNYWDDDCLMRCVALKSELHLHVIAVIGSEEICADQQQDDMRGLNVRINLIPPFITGANAAIMPTGNQTLAFEQR
jgi:hypothetical protein